jgi:hypothetical protein
MTKSPQEVGFFVRVVSVAETPISPVGASLLAIAVDIQHMY